MLLQKKVRQVGLSETRTRCCVFTRTLYNAMFFAYLITIFFAPKKSGIPNSLSERLITYIYIYCLPRAWGCLEAEAYFEIGRAFKLIAYLPTGVVNTYCKPIGELIIVAGRS